MIKKSIIFILVLMLIIPTISVTLSSTKITNESSEEQPNDKGYSHNILGEFFTMTTCVPCKYAHQALKNIYKADWHPFYYITLVYDEPYGNKWAFQRKQELG